MCFDVIPPLCRIYDAAGGCNLRCWLRTMPTMALLVAVTLFSACSQQDSRASDSPEASQEKDPVPVTASPVVRKAVPLQWRTMGTVEATSIVSIKSEVSGPLLEVHFTEGQAVRQGDVLFTIDPTPFEAALHQAESRLARDAAQLQQAEASLVRKIAAKQAAEAQQAHRQTQPADLHIQKERDEGWIEDGDSSQPGDDEVHIPALPLGPTLEANRALLESAGEEIHAAQATVSNARKAVQASRAAVENAHRQLGYTAVRAPVDGHVGAPLCSPGDLVQAHQERLGTIHRVRPVSVAFSIPRQQLAEIRRYMWGEPMAVEATPLDPSGPSALGKLDFTGGTVDPATGAIQFKAGFLNRENRLQLGQPVQVVLTLTMVPNAVVVPAQAVQLGRQGPYVFVLRIDTTATELHLMVEPRPVVVARTIEHEAVIQSGLRPGEQVVTEGQAHLFAGAWVEIRPPESTVAGGEEVSPLPSASSAGPS